MNTPNLPNFLKKYFWDCEFSTLKFEKNPEFVGKRILNLGDLKSIQWLVQHMDKDKIKEIVSTNRDINKKTKNFWQSIL
jgi:hypothetical protein